MCRKRYRAILENGQAKIEQYDPRKDPIVAGYGSVSAAIRALGAYSSPVELPDGQTAIPSNINYPYKV